MEPNAWWKRVPNETARILTFHNRPVSHDDFVSTLLRETQPEDFVAFKLDIDTPWLEEQIVASLLERTELSTRVDELLWEYHVDLQSFFCLRNPNLCAARDTDRQTAARALLPERSNSTVREAIDLMQRLRARGIRSHFWV